MRVLIVEAEPSTYSGGPPGGTNEQHVAVALLRALVDPVATLEEVVSAAAGSDVQAVVWFGSIARGEASAASDIDLAFTAPNGWNDRVEMADAVRTRLGTDCGVLVFTPTEFEERACGGEPAVNDIRRHGVALVGTAGRLSWAYRKPDTCWQHHAALTGGMTHSEPTSVGLYLVPLAVISIGWLSLRIAGLRGAWA